LKSTVNADTPLSLNRHSGIRPPDSMSRLQSKPGGSKKTGGDCLSATDNAAVLIAATRMNPNLQ
jgi:hypothetical protein